MARKPRGAYLLPDVVEPSDVLYVCVPVPNDMGHLLAFLGQLDALGKWTSWQLDPLKQGRDVAQVWANVAALVRENIDNMIGCGGSMELRQNPDDNCQLQWRSSPDDEWHLAFDYGLCIPPYAANIIDQLASNNPPPVSPYAPEATWVYSPGDSSAMVEDRRLALCSAARTFINMALDAYIASIDGTLVVPSIVSFAGSIALALLPFAGVSIWMLVGIAIAKAALDVWINFVAFVDNAMASDTERRERMICYLVETLTGRAITPLNFYAAFSDASVCMTGDDALVADLIYAMMSDVYQRETMYEAFLAALGGTTQAVGAGAEPEDCGCPEASWCHRSNFLDGDLDDWVIVNGSAHDGRIYHAPNPANPSVSYVQIQKVFYVPQGSTITLAQFTWFRANLGNYVVAADMNTATQSCGFGCGSPFGAGGSFTDQEVTVTFTFSTNYDSSATNYIEYAEIHGTGVPIFDGCDNC